MKTSARAFVAVAVLLVNASAMAWNATGHMVIAAIARQQMTPFAVSEADRLLKIGGTEKANDFLTASVWADDTRTPENGPWHYINLHFRSDKQRTDNKPDAENAVVAIERFQKILADRSKPDAERAEALRYILHFVGDLHQPLHAVARDTDEHPKGDRGGNDFKIQPPALLQSQTRPPTNLHALWDGGVGLFPYIDRPLAPADKSAIETQARTLLAAIPSEDLSRASDLNPLNWAKEGLEGAKKTVYDLREGTVPSEEYVRNGQALAARRATMAGLRLASILNEALR